MMPASLSGLSNNAWNLMWLEEYKRSLKMPEAEEVFDLVFYRPLAFLFVKVVYRTPITPNQVTILSAVAGCVAAWNFFVGTPAALVYAAIWYALANILDCSDGQLARLQNSGTLLGRVVDGVADYVSSVAIFIGLGAGLAATGHPMWGMVVAGGLSSALQAIFFDNYQGEYISTVRAETNFLTNEIERFSRECGRLTASGGHYVRLFVLRLYLRYLGFQHRISPPGKTTVDPALYRKRNSRMIRLCSYLGPTTNRTLLIVCALIGRVDLFLWLVMLAGNTWLLFCFLGQRTIRQQPERKAS